MNFFKRVMSVVAVVSMVGCVAQAEKTSCTTVKKCDKPMRIVIGTDGFGVPLRDAVREHLKTKNVKVIELPESNDKGGIPYYVTADKAAKMISSGKADRGILLCGTGMGMSIIANKHKGIYASVCETVGSAEKSRSVNNSNVLTMGALMTTPMTAKEMVDVWLKTEFTQGWDKGIQDWLKGAVKDINKFEEGSFK